MNGSKLCVYLMMQSTHSFNNHIRKKKKKKKGKKKKPRKNTEWHQVSTSNSAMAAPERFNYLYLTFLVSRTILIIVLHTCTRYTCIHSVRENTFNRLFHFAY